MDYKQESKNGKIIGMTILTHPSFFVEAVTVTEAQIIPSKENPRVSAPTDGCHVSPISLELLLGFSHEIKIQTAI